MAESKRPCVHEFYYYLETNEAGWRCANCKHCPGEPPGFCPALDRSETFNKVNGLLLELYNAKFVYISNGSHGLSLAETITARCREEGRFDQYSILLFILEALTPRHAAFWKKISDGVLDGEDPRDRCKIEGCGQLSTGTVGGEHRCKEHRDIGLPEGVPF